MKSGLSDFVQILPAYGKNIYSGITNSNLDFQCWQQQLKQERT